MAARRGTVELRTRILDVAEELFARHAFDGVTTRAIAEKAGTTTGMIHYYFETKRALFDAVFARRADIVNAERLESLDAYEARARGNLTIDGAIAAFIAPVMSKLDKGGRGWRNYLALVAQVANNTEWGGAVMTRSFDPVIRRLLELIRKAVPASRAADLYWSYYFLSGMLLLSLSETDRIDRLSEGECRSTDVAAIEPRMIEFAAAGFERVCRGGS